MNRQQIEKDKKVGQLLKTLTNRKTENKGFITNKKDVVKIQKPKLTWA